MTSMAREQCCSKVPYVLRQDSEPLQPVSPDTSYLHVLDRHDPIDLVMRHEELGWPQNGASNRASRVELITVFAANWQSGLSKTM